MHKNYMKNIFKLETFALIIFFIFSIYGYAHIYMDLYFSKYSFNELFINYQAGFVRRGLLGEVFWHTHSYNNNIDPRLFFGYLFYYFVLFVFLIQKRF